MRGKNDLHPVRNNFDSLRFIFASFVIITHSFSLMGNESKEFLSQFSNGQLSFSFIGLRGFFIISGFLIYQSFERSKSALDFIWKRFLRVFPGLITVSFITAFVAGPLISSLSAGSFFANKDTWLFFNHSVNLLANISHKCLPGVFVSNPHGCEVNGSLWTITYEFLFYIGLMFLFILPNKITVSISLIVVLVLLYMLKTRYVTPYIKYEYYPGNTSIGLKAACDFGSFFVLGSIFAHFKFDQLSGRWLKMILMGSTAIFLWMLYFNLYKDLPFILAPMVLALGLLKFNLLPFLQRTGDISYGTYLYGFPIQQIYIQYFQLNVYALILCSLLTSYLLGFFSWNFVEKPCLRYKSIFAKKNSLTMSGRG